MHRLKQIIRALLFVPVAALLLFEEWGWEPLAAAFARLARWPVWAWMERKISELPPIGALLVFGIPMLALLPVKILALYLFSEGRTTTGLVLLLAAKIGGTAILARLFQLTQPALMQLRWFARWYPRWKAWKEGVLTQMRQSAVWREAGQFKRSVKSWWNSLQR